MRQFVYARLFLIIMLRFTCGEKKICSNIEKSQYIMDMIAIKHYINPLRLFFFVFFLGGGGGGHYFRHALNFAVSDMVKNVNILKETFDTLNI